MKNLAIRTFLPFLAWFPLINRNSLRADFMAGLTGAVVVYPVAGSQGEPDWSISGIDARR